MDTCTTLDDARRISPLVRNLLHSGATAETVICALVNVQTAMSARIMTLEGIAPRGIKMPDGRVMVWRCPDALVPVMEVGP